MVSQGVQAWARAVVLPAATNPPQPRLVLVTPQAGHALISSVSGHSLLSSVVAAPSHQNVDKVLVKTVTKVGKGSHKMFTLPNVDTGVVVARDDVKRAIKSQLQGGIVTGDFDVGIVSGDNVIRSKAVVRELWADIRTGRKTAPERRMIEIN
jgi:hypothetical protein